jgi:hypothetical protein
MRKFANPFETGAVKLRIRKGLATADLPGYPSATP